MFNSSAHRVTGSFADRLSHRRSLLPLCFCGSGRVEGHFLGHFGLQSERMAVEKFPGRDAALL